jgi:hypothetical protein
LFKRRHRLVLEIGSRSDLIGAHDREGFVYFQYEAPPYLARNTVYHGGLNPSHIDIEVIEQA